MRWTLAARESARPAGVRPSRVVLTPRCWRQVCDKKRRRRCQTSLVTGESTKYAVKPLRGECRIASAEPVCSCAFFCNFARETAGAARTRHSLRPLISLGERFLHNSGESRRGIAESWLTPSLRAKRSNPALL